MPGTFLGAGEKRWEVDVHSSMEETVPKALQWVSEERRGAKCHGNIDETLLPSVLPSPIFCHHIFHQKLSSQFWSQQDRTMEWKDSQRRLPGPGRMIRSSSGRKKKGKMHSRQRDKLGKDTGAGLGTEYAEMSKYPMWQGKWMDGVRRAHRN